MTVGRILLEMTLQRLDVHYDGKVRSFVIALSNIQSNVLSAVTRAVEAELGAQKFSENFQHNATNVQ